MRRPEDATEKVFRGLGLRVKRETKSLEKMKSLRDSGELKTEGKDERGKKFERNLYP